MIDNGPSDVTVQKIDPRLANKIPTPRGTIEDALLQAPVNFTSELSSAYNVRGGSFDENLVYVNDIEVYRPFGEIWATRRAVVCKSRHGGPHRIQRGRV